MKQDFPIFKRHPELIYLDSAATAQKPYAVINAESRFYQDSYANVHRGIYHLSESATTLYENVRNQVRDFIHAEHADEIIFTSGSTESINLVAQCFGLTNIQSGDEIVMSVAEHHSNIVPWQQLCERVGSKLVVIPLLENGEIDLACYQNALNSKTKLVTLSHASNVLGIINPIKKIITAAHEKNIPVLIDGAQAVAHIPVDVQELDCDFYVFSAHKLYGPTGVGVLYGKKQHLEKMPPYQFGGNMIRQVSFEKTEFNGLPYKFEAGTPNIGGVIGLGAAIDYMMGIGDRGSVIGLTPHNEQELLTHATTELQKIPGLTIYGTAKNKLGVISFAMKHAHPHDIATILDQSNIAVRAGHHCAMPLMHYLKVPALTRVSFGVYNTLSDVDALIVGLYNVRKLFHE